MNNQKKEIVDAGDFEELDESAEKPRAGLQQHESARVRMPRGKQLLGIIAQRLGGNRMEVKTTTGKIMNCRVPGSFKRSMWLRPRDIVLIEPWEHDTGKGDVVFKYNSSDIIQLRKRGFLSSLNAEF